MAYSLDYINRRVKEDPQGFVDESDALYNKRISLAADRIQENMARSPIVLLSGPSGSGKTTTAHKVNEELERRGIRAHTVSMDNYFKTLNQKTCPRTTEGEIDFESPRLMDMDLLNEHFADLAKGREIRIPYFLFTYQRRSVTQFKRMRLKENEIAIFEGIHALNDDITEKTPDAFKLYISAASDVEHGEEIIYRREWMRLIRRIVRDNNFRGADAVFTLTTWPNVLRGEVSYINPFVDKADLLLDSSLPYEVPVIKQFALPLLEAISDGRERFEVVRDVIPALKYFADLGEQFIKPESLLREFIGGGVYEY
ncbi:MAG: uridine kinase [Oscillospiraceae bacterium]